MFRALLHESIGKIITVGSEVIRFSQIGDLKCNIAKYIPDLNVIIFEIEKQKITAGFIK